MNETTTYTETQIDDWSNIFGASAGMWSWWRGIAHLTGDWDTPGRVLLTIEDPDNEDKVINRPFFSGEIFDALHKAEVLYPHLYHRNQDGFLDLDASSADVVLQVALFGEAIYG
jgi:hypothetical protein